MKKILGSITLVAFVFLSALQAGYTWEVKLDKKTYYQNEAFLVTFLCHFDNRSPDVFIEFNPKIEGVTFERLDFHNQVINGKREVHYRYFAKVAKSGKKRFSVDALMRVTTDDSIKETVLGRDNDQDLVFVDTKIKTKPHTLQILPIPEKASLVGSFDMEISYSNERLQAFQPLQVKVQISGQGDFKQLKVFDIKLDDGKVFTQDPEIAYKLTEKGYMGKLTWRYAMTSEKDFTLAKQSIHYFDPKDAKLKSLDFPEKSFKVIAAQSKDSLVDRINYPEPTKEFDWYALMEKAFYFLLGVIFVLMLLWIRKNVKKSVKKAKKFKNIADLVGFLIKNGQYQQLLKDIEEDINDKKVKRIGFYAKQMDKKDRR